MKLCNAVKRVPAAEESAGRHSFVLDTQHFVIDFFIFFSNSPLPPWKSHMEGSHRIAFIFFTFNRIRHSSAVICGDPPHPPLGRSRGQLKSKDSRSGGGFLFKVCPQTNKLRANKADYIRPD